MTADLFICFHICVHVHVYQSDCSLYSNNPPVLHFLVIVLHKKRIYQSFLSDYICSAFVCAVFAQDMYKNQGASSFHTRSLCFKQPNTIQMYLMVFPNEIKQKSGATNDLEI